MDFACKTISAEQVLRCSLGLTKAGCALLHALRAKKDWLTSEELAKKTRYDLATTQRNLKHLYERGAVERRQENRKQGGYTYYYKIISEEELHNLVFSTIDEWLVNAKKEVKDWLKKK